MKLKIKCQRPPREYNEPLELHGPVCHRYISSEMEMIKIRSTPALGIAGQGVSLLTANQKYPAVPRFLSPA